MKSNRLTFELLGASPRSTLLSRNLLSPLLGPLDGLRLRVRERRPLCSPSRALTEDRAADRERTEALRRGVRSREGERARSAAGAEGERVSVRPRDGVRDVMPLGM